MEDSNMAKKKSTQKSKKQNKKQKCSVCGKSYANLKRHKDKMHGSSETSRQEVVVTIRSQEQALVPVEALVEPMKDGKNMTLQPTWVEEKQLLRMLQNTPKEHVYKRKGRGNMQFDYVTGSYCQKWLNFVFGWNWDFVVLKHGKEEGQVWVLGQLTVRGTKPGQQIVKTQFGRADIKKQKGKSDAMDFGNDLKAASTDALKKCASLIGFASDIYGKTDYIQETGNDVREASIDIPEVDESDLFCHGVGKAGCGGKDSKISKQEFDFSKRVYGKPLCRDCQKLAKRNK